MAKEGRTRPKTSDTSYFVAGRGAWQAAAHIMAHPEYQDRLYLVMLPVYHLIGFSIEAFYKAWLAHSGNLTSDVLSLAPYGHNIHNLMVEAWKTGLIVEAPLRDLTELISKPYSLHEYRYMPDGATYALLDTHAALQILQLLERQIDDRTSARTRVLGTEEAKAYASEMAAMVKQIKSPLE